MSDSRNSSAQAVKMQRVAFTQVYTDDQRLAVAHAWADLQLRPARVIVNRARAGELTINGVTLAPFDAPEASVRQIGKQEERRRRGLGKSKLADQPPRDAVESVRRRLCAALEHELDKLEREQRVKGSEPIDALRITKLARAGRELAALPGPDDPRPSAPAPTRAKAQDNTLAGQLRRTVRGKGHQPKPEDTTVHPPPQGHTEQHTESANDAQDEPNHSAATQQTTNTHNDHDDDEPGSRPSADFGALTVERLTVRSA